MIITKSTEMLTSSLPYVEVVLDRIFSADHLMNIWIDKDRVYLELNNNGMAELEVTEISSGVCTS